MLEVLSHTKCKAAECTIKWQKKKNVLNFGTDLFELMNIESTI